MSSVWLEIQRAQTESRHELTLSGCKLAEKVSENGGMVDESLYEIGEHLNYLKLAKLGLTKISSKISNLSQLTQLSIIQNEINEIPFEISFLVNLVYLDLSDNMINTVPDIFSNLSKLRTINLRNNQISQISCFKGLTSLQELFLDHNKILCLPEDIFTLSQLMVLDLSSNEILDIPVKICELKQLKVLNLENNQINNVIPELSRMSRLKQLKLQNNPLKNVKTQFKKLINDNLYKAMTEYLKKLDLEIQKKETDTNQRKTPNRKSHSSIEDCGESQKFVKITNENSMRKIFVKNRPNLLKPHLVYFAVHNLEFTQDKFKKFIKFQEHLHKNECDSRKLCTVGVHDLSTVRFPLVYSTRQSDDFHIQMMNRSKSESGKSLYERLLKEAELERKNKKRGTITGVYQYLYMINIDSLQGVVEDCNGEIISYPPLTNCNLTKITPETNDLLVEVIGAKLDKCKSICEAIIQWLIENEVTSSIACLEIEPIRVFEDNSESSLVDGGQNLLVVFPSRLDLNGLGLAIIREQ